MAAILVVEDDPAVARHTAQRLRGMGHRPILAADVCAARRELTHHLPDLILLDLGLPGLPGEDLLAWLGACPDTAWIPVLVMAGRDDAVTRLCRAAGARVPVTLQKPVADDELARAVTAALARRGREESTPAPLEDPRRWEVIRHLIAAGPDRLAAHVYRRLAADRRERTAGMTPNDTLTCDTLTWHDMGLWAVLAGVLDVEQALLLVRTAKNDGRIGHASWPDVPGPPKRGSVTANAGMRPNHGREAMSSIRGFRCNKCHAELVTGRSPGGAPTAPNYMPPISILCCGRPLQALRPDQIVAAVPIRRRAAHCRRCGYAIDLVVHPAGPLVCMLCQVEFEVSAPRPTVCDRVAADVASGGEAEA